MARKGIPHGELADAIGFAPHYLGHRGRLQERLLNGGAEALPDYEILEMLLAASNPRGDTKPLAKRLIDHFGGSLAAVLSADPAKLRSVSVEGRRVGVAGAAMLKAVREAALRLSRAELASGEVIGSWDKLIDYCKANIAHGTVEEFHLLFLNRKNELIKHERQQRGTIDHTPVYPREVVKRALELDASALILVHNHVNPRNIHYLQQLELSSQQQSKQMVSTTIVSENIDTKSPND
jgi:DNA repair protein RadC